MSPLVKDIIGVINRKSDTKGLEGYYEVKRKFDAAHEVGGVLALGDQ